VRREADLARRLRSLETLKEAVGAMKSLSAHHFREVRGSVAPARLYREGVERVLAWSGASLAAGDGPAGLLVVGGDLGLCGAYNARVVHAAAERRRALGPGPTVCVGHRAAMLLRRRGVEIRAVHGAPSGVRGIPDLLLRLAEDMLTRYVEESQSALEVVSCRFLGVGAETPANTRLLPLEAGAARGAPLTAYVSGERLASAAVREFLYVALYDLLLDGLASEHGARLLATQAAEEWLDGRTGVTRKELAAIRREASTQEVIEIAFGARARSGTLARAGTSRKGAGP
jgi:F-type H+-transporting ATPase subunit gamma